MCSVFFFSPVKVILLFIYLCHPKSFESFSLRQSSDSILHSGTKLRGSTLLLLSFWDMIGGICQILLYSIYYCIESPPTKKDKTYSDTLKQNLRQDECVFWIPGQFFAPPPQLFRHFLLHFPNISSLLSFLRATLTILFSSFFSIILFILSFTPSSLPISYSKRHSFTASLHLSLLQCHPI